MAYKRYKLILFLRVIILFLCLLALAFGVNRPDKYIIVSSLIGAVFSVHGLYKHIIRRFLEIDDFFEAVKYRDFSRWFNEKSGPEDMRRLYKGFNEVNKTIKEINSEKETQHLYLQKILEMVDAGIIAYNLSTGNVLWLNEAFKEIADTPAFKRISFVEKRKPSLYNEIFETVHHNGDTININIEGNAVKALISSSVFAIGEEKYKLIVLQNIDDTLNKTESEAWKKLLSVMTHEIMNSIAPISSLAETLQSHIKQSVLHPEQTIDMEDLEAGIESIKKRSEGLLMFAKTYRSLNKVTNLNLSKVSVGELFENIKNLMQPSLDAKGIKLIFNLEDPDLCIQIDAYLIEQVLINLILNSVEACEAVNDPHIIISANKKVKGTPVITVTDNGKGIPEEIIDRIFVPFFTTKKSGSGIGLSLCKQIMLLHKGRVQIKSIEGEGTMINLKFMSEY
ncbi:sensor histidine kinase [Abyssalbus ytuae]|uniref:histidine kinase n=1 Tax=Abyssalbus ytuae TaxID=2926907 RepID=A0A9E7CXY8_9FLAO|nr:HAMP domain-containing sensor histidine kinase [Abyssalbus ytuae]UOB16075.1 HAMP domain-containing histidine kinase [Abyssalbus ytuae]